MKQGISIILLTMLLGCVTSVPLSSTSCENKIGIHTGDTVFIHCSSNSGNSIENKTQCMHNPSEPFGTGGLYKNLDSTEQIMQFRIPPEVPYRCNLGTEVGENMNYYYCYIRVPASQEKIVDKQGNILEEKQHNEVLARIALDVSDVKAGIKSHESIPFSEKYSIFSAEVKKIDC